MGTKIGQLFHFTIKRDLCYPSSGAVLVIMAQLWPWPWSLPLPPPPPPPTEQLLGLAGLAPNHTLAPPHPHQHQWWTTLFSPHFPPPPNIVCVTLRVSPRRYYKVHNVRHLSLNYISCTQGPFSCPRNCHVTLISHFPSNEVSNPMNSCDANMKSSNHQLSTNSFSNSVQITDS